MATFIDLSLLLNYVIDVSVSVLTSVWGAALRKRSSEALATLLVALPLWVLA